MKRVIASTIVTLFTLLNTTTYVFAKDGSGGESPYSPYGGHDPVDTALSGNLDLFIVLGIVAYIIGFVFIAQAKALKSKLG